LDSNVFGVYKALQCLPNDWKSVTIYSGAGIIGKSVSKTFTKQNMGKRLHVTGI
jgi:hypothetical protein